MRNTSHHNTHTLTHTHTITNTHIKSRSAAVKLWFNHRSNTVFAGKSVEVKNKYFRLQWLSSGSDTILTANNVNTFCFVPINTSASMCYRGVLHRSLLTCRKTAFPPIKTKGKKKLKIAHMQAKNSKKCCAERGAEKSAVATTVISPCDLLLADMLCWPLLTLSAITSP